MTESHATPDGADRSPRPGKRHRLRNILLALIALLVVAGCTAWWLLKSEPDFVLAQQAYVDGLSPREIKSIAVGVEQSFLAVLDSPIDGNPPTGPREFVISIEEANLWLSTRLPAWLAHQGQPLPAQISQIMAGVEDDHFVVGFMVDTEELRQRVSAVVDLQFIAPGKARIQLIETRGGKLPLPMATITGVLKKNAATGQIKRTINKIETLVDGAMVPMIFDYDRKRRLAIDDLAVHDGMVHLKVRLTRR